MQDPGGSQIPGTFTGLVMMLEAIMTSRLGPLNHTLRKYHYQRDGGYNAGANVTIVRPDYVPVQPPMALVNAQPQVMVSMQQQPYPYQQQQIQPQYYYPRPPSHGHLPNCFLFPSVTNTMIDFAKIQISVRLERRCILACAHCVM